jgi:hypothetical protein
VLSFSEHPFHFYAFLVTDLCCHFSAFLFQATTAFQPPKLSATFTLQAKADAQKMRIGRRRFMENFQ